MSLRPAQFALHTHQATCLFKPGRPGGSALLLFSLAYQDVSTFLLYLIKGSAALDGVLAEAQQLRPLMWALLCMFADDPATHDVCVAGSV